jgi:hypothetical protein
MAVYRPRSGAPAPLPKIPFDIMWCLRRRNTRSTRLGDLYRIDDEIGTILISQ